MFAEFKAFIARGNVLDLAVAVIIGAAFATITSSLTEDLLMPVIGSLSGDLDFSNHFVLLGPVPEGFTGNPASYSELKEAGAAVLGWGQFVTVVLNFLILAFVIFLIVRYANRMRKTGDGPAAPSEVQLLAEIRDELKRRA